MNLGSKAKKRAVLPSRPDPPTVERILEDMSRAAPDDPVFSILERTGQDSPPAGDTEQRFQQLRRFMELQEHLREAGERLLRQREELQAAGGKLERDITEVKGQTL